MKIIRQILFSGLVFSSVSAAATISLVNVTAAGSNSQYNYSAALSGNNSFSAGDFFVIYDFSGYVASSCVAPTGFSCSQQFTGPTPNGAVTDSASIINLVFTATAPSAKSATISGFSAQSTNSATTNLNDQSTEHNNGGNVVNSSGTVTGPAVVSAAVPEPSTSALVGSALLGLSTWLRRRRNS